MLRADNLATFVCRLSWNLGTSTSWNPLGLFRVVMGLLYLLPQNLPESLEERRIYSPWTWIRTHDHVRCVIYSIDTILNYYKCSKFYIWQRHKIKYANRLVLTVSRHGSPGSFPRWYRCFSENFIFSPSVMFPSIVLLIRGAFKF